jgi:hypothetical protein
LFTILNSKASLKVGFGLSSPRKGVNVPNEEKTFIDREGNLGTGLENLAGAGSLEN